MRTMPTDAGTREWFARALMKAGVYTLLERGIEAAFVDGTADVPMGDLEMDSLAAMQFCIEMEKAWGVSVTPSELRAFGSLLEVVTYVEGARAD